MSVIDFAKEHFTSLGRQQLAVPEWGKDGQPLIIYWSPVTAREHNKIYPPSKDPGVEAAATALVLKAEDADGKRLFRDIDKDDLMTKVDRVVLIRVAAAIVTGAGAEAVKAAEKN